MCVWPVVETAKDGGTRMRNDWAVVVAPPGILLQPGSPLLLTTAWDIGAEDRDLFETQLLNVAVRLSEDQRTSWGSALHQIGRVYWVVDPDPSQEGQDARKT